MKRRSVLATLGMVGSSGCLWLEDAEPGGNGSIADPSNADEQGASDAGGGPAPPVTLSEAWTAEEGIDYVWAEEAKFYFNSFNAAAEATYGDGIQWVDDEVTFEDDTENLGANAFARTDRFAIFGYTPDHAESRCHFHAFDVVEGEEVWAYRVPDFGTFVGAVDVTIVEDVAIVAGNVPGPDNEPTVWGLDLETGEEVWRGDDSLSSRAVSYVGEHGGDVYVGTTTGGTSVLDPSDGTRLGQHESWEVRTTRWGSGGRIHGDTLFAVTGSGVAAYPIDDGGVEWSVDDVDDVLTAPAVDNSLVAVGTNSGDVLAFDRETGDTRWEQGIDGTVRAVELSAFRVWVANHGTGLAAFDRGDGTTLHRSTKPIDGSDIGIASDVILLGGGGARAYEIVEE